MWPPTGGSLAARRPIELFAAGAAGLPNTAAPAVLRRNAITTIGSLSYAILADHSRLTGGIAASRSELRELKSAFEQSRSPVERFSHDIERLTALAQKFPASSEFLHRRIGQIKAEMAASSPEAQRLAARNEMVANTLSRMGLVLDPISAGFQAMRLGMDLARSGLVLFERISERVIDRMEKLDQLAKKSAVLGIGPSSLVGLRRAAADISGVGSDQFDTGLTAFSRRTAEAATEGKGEAFEAFDRLGLSARELSGMRVDEALLEVADAMAKVQNPAERLRLSYQLLGKQGTELATMLAAGSAEIRKLSEDERQLSQLDFIDLDRIESANDAMGRARTALEGIFNLLAHEVSPAVIDAADGFTSMFQDASEDGERLREVLGFVGQGVRQIVNDVQALSKLSLPFAEDLFLPEEAQKLLGMYREWQDKLQGMGIELGKVGGGKGGSVAEVAQRADLAEKAAAAAEKAETKRAEELVKIEEKRQQSELKAQEERMDKARQVMLSMRTDGEQLFDRFAQIRNLPLDETTRVRALEDLRQQALDLSGHGGAVPRTVSAVHAGSVEALRAQFGPRATDEKQLAEQRKTAANTKQATALLEQIRRELETAPLIGVVQ